MALEPPFSVILADAHVDYRDGLARAIAAEQELALIGVVGDGNQALQLIESRRPDLALVDVRLPGRGGLVISRQLMEREPPLPTRIVIVNTLLDLPDRALYKARSLGAAGLLGKDASRRDICEALIAAARGRSWVSPDPTVGIVYPRSERVASARALAT
jgi:two-component system, NarL family, nitrate/nitrite response regulator NarL